MKKLLIGLAVLSSMSAFAFEDVIFDANEVEVSNELVDGIQNDSDKKNVLKSIKEARADFRLHKMDPVKRKQMKEFQSKVDDLKKGRISNSLKESFLKAQVQCTDKVDCSSQLEDLSEKLKEYFIPNSTDGQYVYQPKYSGLQRNVAFKYNPIATCSRNWDGVPSKAPHGFGRNPEGVDNHLVVFGKNETRCVSPDHSSFYKIKNKTYGVGLEYAEEKASLIICPIGLRQGVHVGLTASAIFMVGADVTTFFGASGVCAEIGVKAGGIGAKAAIQISKIKEM